MAKTLVLLKKLHTVDNLPQCPLLMTRCFSEIWVDTLRPRHNFRDFADDTFKCILLNGNIWMSIKFSFKFVPKGLIDNVAALFKIMALPRPGDKPLSEPMMVSLLTHIWVTRCQWAKDKFRGDILYCGSLQGINKIADGNWSRNSFWMTESKS